MQITFDALDAALAPIAEIGQDELTFDVNGVPVTMRVLTPEQEVDVQKYANEAIQGGEESMSNTADYLERFKVAVMSHAIIAVGNLDLRGVEAVETGDVLESGQPVKITKLMAVRRLILKWTGTVRLSVFRKYGELLEKVERKAEKAIKFEPADIEAEINRLESRLQELREVKEKEDKEDMETPVSRLARSMAREGATEQDQLRDHVSRAAVRVPEEETSPEETPPAQGAAPAPPQAARERQPIIPSSAPPPGAQRPNVAAPDPTPPQQPQSPQQETPPEPPQPLPDEGSFVDAGDEDAMKEAVEAENRRLMAMRQGQVPQNPAVAPPTMRKPPHQEAKVAAESLLDVDPSQIDESQLRHPQRRKAPDGADAVQLQPPEELTQPRTDPRSGDSFQVNQKDTSKSKNPRFQPPKKG